MVEYGFAIPDNRYDFVRRSNLNLASFYGELMSVSPDVKAKFEQKLNENNLKDTLQADLKLMGLHRDVLRLLRCFVTADREVKAAKSGFVRKEPSWHEIETECV